MVGRSGGTGRVNAEQSPPQRLVEEVDQRDEEDAEQWPPRCLVEEVVQRDVKGLYRKALKGEIKNFIGVDSSTPYESPIMPHLVIETGRDSVDVSVRKFIDFVHSM